MTDNLLALGATSLGIGTYVALALMFILLAPRQRTHQLLALGALALALNYGLLQVAITAHNNSAEPALILNLERLMAALFLAEGTARLFGIIYFLKLQDQPVYRRLSRIVFAVVLAIFVLISPLFDRYGAALVAQVYQPNSVYPIDFLKYVRSETPFMVVTALAGLSTILTVNLINTYLFHKHQVARQAIWGSYFYLLALLATAVPALVWLVPWVMMVGGLLTAHAVLTSTLFNPLRKANEDLQRSVSRTRSLSQQLEQTLAAAEQEVAQRTEALAYALDRERMLAKELEHSLEIESDINKLKSKIITNVSHEFRTPLTIIKSSSELLTAYYDKISEQKRQKYRGQITAQIAYLDEVLVDILFINDSDGDSLRPDWHWYSFAELGEQLTQAWQGGFAGQAKLQFAFKGADEEPIRSDLSMLKKVGNSLLSNAVKYAAPDPQVGITYRQNGAALQLEFKDNGIGIPAGEEETIFDLFYRASNVDNQRGMGLGLYSVSKMINALGGTICVKQTSSQGTTFAISLPLTKPDEQQVESELMAVTS